MANFDLAMWHDPEVQNVVDLVGSTYGVKPGPSAGGFYYRFGLNPNWVSGVQSFLL